MRLLPLHKPRQRDLWDHPNNMWLPVMVCECACHRLSSLVTEPLYCNTGSGYPWMGLGKVLLGFVMTKSHAPAASLRLPCQCQEGPYGDNGVRFKPCSPHIDSNSIYGFGDVSQVWQLCHHQGISPRNVPGCYLMLSFAPWLCFFCLFGFFFGSPPPLIIFIISNYIF